MQYPQTILASFKRPALLPGHFSCHWQPGTSGNKSSTEFAVCSEATGKTVISGEYTCGTDSSAKI